MDFKVPFGNRNVLNRKIICPLCKDNRLDILLTANATNTVAGIVISCASCLHTTKINELDLTKSVEEITAQVIKEFSQ